MSPLHGHIIICRYRHESKKAPSGFCGLPIHGLDFWVRGCSHVTRLPVNRIPNLCLDAVTSIRCNFTGGGSKGSLALRFGFRSGRW